MKKTIIKFDYIEEDKELKLLFGCYANDNQTIDAIVSLIGFSIQGKRITTLKKDEDIVYIGFGDNSKVSKQILYNKEFIIIHYSRTLISIIEI